MKMSEGRGASWEQSRGQEDTLSLPCFLLGVVDRSSLTKTTTASPISPRSKAGGPPVSFITRSYLLFHSRLMRAEDADDSDEESCSRQEQKSVQAAVTAHL